MRILPRAPARLAVAITLATAIPLSACSKSSGERAPETSAPAAATPAASPASPAPPARPAPFDQSALDAMREASQKMAAPVDGSDLDVDRKAADLGPDVNRLFAFVRDDIGCQVYAGVLRGARGTLTGRAGNAWDKSVLLAALLRHHSREVRFARGTLTPDRAAAVVAKMFDDARRTPARPAIELPPSLLARGRSTIAGIETRWRSAHADLEQALSKNGMTFGASAPVTNAALAGEAADHAWIEYRDGDQWVALDPMLGTRAGEAVASALATFAEIPPAVHHRVTFRVILEQRKGQTLEERNAFVWRSTAAALHGASVLFTHRFDRTPLGQWRATPVLVVDGQAYGALSFSSAGLTESKPANALVGDASRQMQELGRVNEVFGGTAPAQPARAASEWMAERLEVEFTDPAGHIEIVRREIADRLDPVTRARANRAAASPAPIRIVAGIPSALTGLYGLAVTAGPLDPRLLRERLVTAFAARGDAVALRNVKVGEAATLSADDRARAGRVLASLPPVLEASAVMVHALSQSLARRFVAGGAVELYEATPRLALVSLEPSGQGMAVDLRRNALRVVGRGASGQDLARANFARGVLDGVIEDTIVTPSSDAPGVQPLSAVAALEAAHAQNIPIAASTSVEAARSNASEVARARMQASAGPPTVIVAPIRPVAVGGAARMAWWSIDLTTGETLGVLDSGLHGAQTMSEYAGLDLLEKEMATRLGAGFVESGAGPTVDVLADTVPGGLGGLGEAVQAATEREWELFVYYSIGY